MRILIVEDEPDLLASLAQALREEGYAVDTADNGDDGLFNAEGTDYAAGARHLCRFNVRTEWGIQMNPLPPAIRMLKRHKCRAPAAVHLHGFGLDSRHR